MHHAATQAQSISWCKVQRRKFLRHKSSSVSIQCWCHYISALAIYKIALRAHCCILMQSQWCKALVHALWRKLRWAAVTIQATARGGAILRPLYRERRAEAIENAKLENQIKILHEKLEEAERRHIAPERLAAENASGQPPTIIYQDNYGASEDEKKNEIHFSAEQQALMLESGKMLDYWRKEVFKLRTQNAQLWKSQKYHY